MIEFWLWVVIGILTCMVVGLWIRILLLRKAAGEIGEKFAKRLRTDTNVLIDISSGDRNMKKLAENINTELQNLQRQRHRYLEGDRELKEAVINISHDLRTPLTAVMGYLELLEEEEKTETVQRYLEQIEGRTEVMKQLTEELFSYSIIASEEEERREEVDLRRAFEESLLSFQGAMERRGIIPRLVLPQTPVVRTLDKVSMGRILSNIISNALKYSDGDFTAELRADGNMVFSNSAKTLDAVATARLFDRFYTVETGRNSTGLGLSIAKLLTERMGGKIHAEYQQGRLLIRIAFPQTRP